MQIQLKNISYTYKLGTYKINALDNINLTINKNDFVGVMGDTGSGKSTLMQILNGTLVIQEGKMYFNRQEINRENINQLRKSVGLLFQFAEMQLFAETVEKDVQFGPKNYGIRGKALTELVRESLELVGLSYEKYKNRSPFSLSGGEQRRVALAGVLALKPEVLILDEPTVGLDPKGKKNLLDLLQKLHQEGLTIIVVSHRIDEVVPLAQKIVVLHKGKIILNDSPEEVLKQKSSLHNIGLELPVGQRLLCQLKARGWKVNDNLYLLEDVEREILKFIRSGEGCV